MSKLLLVLRRVLVVAGLIMGVCAHADPVIYFSDLISAPKSGWSAAESSKGGDCYHMGAKLWSQQGRQLRQCKWG